MRHTAEENNAIFPNRKEPFGIPKGSFFAKHSLLLSIFHFEFAQAPRPHWRWILRASILTQRAQFLQSSEIFRFENCVSHAEGLPQAAFPCSPRGKSHFRKSYARLHGLLFLYKYFLNRTAFSTGEGLPLAAFPCSPRGKSPFSEKLRPLTLATFFVKNFP